MDAVIGPLVKSITLFAEDAITSTELFPTVGARIAFTWGGSLEKKSYFILALSARTSSASSLILQSNSLGMQSSNSSSINLTFAKPLFQLIATPGEELPS